MKKEKKILLVDDDEAVRLSFKRDLSEYYNVTDASGCTEAIACLSKNSYDLILTDLAMPGGDGLELLKRAKVIAPEVCVILISGYGDMESVIEALRAGADDFLLKPCNLDELLFRISKSLEKQDYFKKIKVYEKIVSVTEELITLVDRNAVYLEANSSYLQAYNRNRAELIGYSMPEILGQDLFDAKIAPWLAQCFSGTTVQHQDIFRLAGQEYRTMVTSFTPVFTNDRISSAVVSMRDVTEFNHALFQLQKSEERMRLALDASSDGVWDHDIQTGSTHFGNNWHRLLGYEPDALQNNGVCWQDLLHPDDKASALAAEQACLDGRTERLEAEFRLRTAAGAWQWILAKGMVVERDKTGTPLRFIGTHTDISSRKKTEEELRRINEILEQKVVNRTAELDSQNAQLAEANAALNVVLKKRQLDKGELEESLIANISQLIEPLLQKLQRTQPSDQQTQLLNAIELNLRHITSSFVPKLSSRHINLTPTEVQVANHVKQGKSTKEIADILCLAPETVNVHRKKIRRKLGINNKAMNLRTFLSSLSDS